MCTKLKLLMSGQFLSHRYPCTAMWEGLPSWLRDVHQLQCVRQGRISAVSKVCTPESKHGCSATLTTALVIRNALAYGDPINSSIPDCSVSFGS